MKQEQLKQRFFELVAPDLPNEWDVEEALEHLADMPADLLAEVFKQIPVIWPVSNALCYSYLSQVSRALDCIEPALLPRWVNDTLDQYERSGLKVAQRFMMDVQGHFVCRLQGKSGLRFGRVESRLLLYVRGLAGESLDLERADIPYTDTATVFLPREISLFEAEQDNFLLYKLTASFQWRYIEQGSFLLSSKGEDANPSPDGALWLQDHLDTFSSPDLLADIYHTLETIRASAYLVREFPGLMRDTASLLAGMSPCAPDNSKVGCLFSALQRKILRQPMQGEYRWARMAEGLLADSATAVDSLQLAEKIYAELDSDSSDYQRVRPLPFQGRMDLAGVAVARMKLRKEQETLFIDGLATLLLNLERRENVEDPADRSEEMQQNGAPAPPDDPSALVMAKNRDPSGGEKGIEQRFINIGNREIELNDELAELADTIISDLGHIPDHYISSVAGKAGDGSPGRTVVIPADDGPATGQVTYDEWDFRRSGYRRNWCVVREKEIPLIRSTFIRNTLAGYHGQIMRLRHQFEMMRTRERFVRRQRDGDDIDLDALVESLADTVAGRPPSDRLFIRLKRDERDIAALFLVDMSNSTRGWVGKAIKESLVLICEAMETLGDRYAIYGFSGMRRLRCEIFPVKEMDQPYSDVVQERIGSIAPREYTRMAPAIRHMTSMLSQVDARVRLLITLSDGKPEDYDDYKGEYAIEDTRHALIEAKMAGIHPFCITIDRHAHDYMDHMYGEVNYIFIDDVGKLPARMPEIYRVLTS